ncbi:MAG: transglutaminase domain-containing protein [Alphaproteobacteria bacterium]|nr:transglutaminase domain-containing protein [Alphaproteobacteria bacterium]
MNKIKYILFLLVISVFDARAEIKILEWKEDAKLTEYGRESLFSIKIQTKNLPKNTGILSFLISSASQKKIEYSSLKVDLIDTNFKNQNGVFEVLFNRPLLDNQTANIEFIAKEYYPKISKYLRQEPLYIPAFAEGSFGEVVIRVGNDLELISSHKNISSRNNIISYKGRVSGDGIKEILKLTNSGVVWDVAVRSKINISSTSGTMEITAPYLFRGGAQSVRNQTIGANIFPKQHLTTRENDILTFDITPKINEIIIENKAEVATGKKFRIENDRSPEKYLEITESEKILLTPILKKILLNPKYDTLPLYVKILNYVHDNIIYDLSYYGKLLTVEKILETKSGVCSEYATLFNALARLANIPSSIVHGYALGEYDKFESHAWNMIFINNRWVHVDPTWNLSSGVVSSSHIYLKDNRKEEILVKFQGQETNIQIDREFMILDSKKY